MSIEQYACLGWMVMFGIKAAAGFYMLAGAIELADWWSRRKSDQKKRT